jgi:hypothetical protein
MIVRVCIVCAVWLVILRPPFLEAQTTNAQTAIDRLSFKGTHNSYNCGSGDEPRMHHSLTAQIDDFGVWALELDFSVVRFDGRLVTGVGHDGYVPHRCG